MYQLNRAVPEDLSAYLNRSIFTTRQRFLSTDDMKLVHVLEEGESKELGTHLPSHIRVNEAALIADDEGVVVGAGDYMLRITTERAYKLAEALIYAADCYEEKIKENSRV